MSSNQRGISLFASSEFADAWIKFFTESLLLFAKLFEMCAKSPRIVPLGDSFGYVEPTIFLATFIPSTPSRTIAITGPERT